MFIRPFGILPLALLFVTSTALAQTPALRLVPPDGAARDLFGKSLALDGNIAVIGAYFKTVNNQRGAGQVYIYERSGTSWSPATTLAASTPHAYDRFGHAVAAANGWLAVGAYQADTPSEDAGSVTFFQRDASGWMRRSVIASPIPQARAYFGSSLGLDGGRAIAGAFGANAFRGSAVVCRLVAGSWEVEKLTASAAAPYSYFGYAVALAGDLAAVGAPNEIVEKRHGAGAVYLFRRVGSSWTQIARVTNPQPETNDFFVCALAIDNGLLVVGAQNKRVHGQANAGSVLVFRERNGSWEADHVFAADPAQGGGVLGVSLASSGNLLVVGAPGETNAEDRSTGAAYLMRRTLDSAAWTPLLRLEPSADYHLQRYGFSVGANGDTVAIGAFGSDDAGANSGAAYLYNALALGGGQDSDQDGLPDAWEVAHFSNLDQSGQTDFDQDGVTNAQEFLLGLNPTRSDSDNDGTPDGQEDPDGDGVRNTVEFSQNSDPLIPDTDFDGRRDGNPLERDHRKQDHPRPALQIFTPLSP